MNGFCDAGSESSLLTGVPDNFVADRALGMAALPAREQPLLWLVRERAPVLTQLFQQLRAQHHVAIFAAFATLHMDDHAFTIDIAELQPRPFCATQPGR